MPELLLALLCVVVGWRLVGLYRAHKRHRAWLRDMRRHEAEFQDARSRYDRLFKREVRRG